MAYRLTGAARRQIGQILTESRNRHGAEAASRYEDLIFAALDILGEAPHAPGSGAIIGLSAARSYPIRHARRRMPRDRRVGRPRHVLVYVVEPEGTAAVLGVVHDAMLLPRVARRLVRRVGQG